MNKQRVHWKNRNNWQQCQASNNTPLVVAQLRRIRCLVACESNCMAKASVRNFIHTFLFFLWPWAFTAPTPLVFDTVASFILNQRLPWMKALAAINGCQCRVGNFVLYFSFHYLLFGNNFEKFMRSIAILPVSHVLSEVLRFFQPACQWVFRFATDPNSSESKKSSAYDAFNVGLTEGTPTYSLRG